MSIFRAENRGGDDVSIEAVNDMGTLIAVMYMGNSEAINLAANLIDETTPNNLQPFFNYHTDIFKMIVEDVYGNIYATCPNEDIANDVVVALNLVLHLGKIDQATSGPRSQKPIPSTLFRDLPIGTTFKFEGERFYKINDSQVFIELDNGCGWQFDPRDFNMDATIVTP